MDRVKVKREKVKETKRVEREKESETRPSTTVQGVSALFHKCNITFVESNFFFIFSNKH